MSQQFVICGVLIGIIFIVSFFTINVEMADYYLAFKNVYYTEDSANIDYINVSVKEQEFEGEQERVAKLTLESTTSVKPEITSDQVKDIQTKKPSEDGHENIAKQFVRIIANLSIFDNI